MYNQSPEQVKSILDVWKIIEVLTPNKNENLNKYYEELEKHKKGNGGTFCKKLSDNDVLLLLKDNPFKNVINSCYALRSSSNHIMQFLKGCLISL